MKFLCKLLIWTFCACLLAFRTQAKKGQRPITYHCVLVVTIVVCFAGFAHARWKPEYANMPAEIRAWYAQAQTMQSSERAKYLRVWWWSAQASARIHFQSRKATLSLSFFPALTAR